MRRKELNDKLTEYQEKMDKLIEEKRTLGLANSKLQAEIELMK